jgi:hypothetical protein
MLGSMSVSVSGSGSEPGDVALNDEGEAEEGIKLPWPTIIAAEEGEETRREDEKRREKGELKEGEERERE